MADVARANEADRAVHRSSIGHARQASGLVQLGGARRSAYLRAVSDIDVERLQASLNRFTNRWLENVAPLIVDGEKGFLTNRRIMTVKWYLGYLGERDGKVTSRFGDVRERLGPRL
jgi:hypothetical protein